MNAAGKQEIRKGWRATLVSILWTRLTLENWRAKLLSLVLATTVWYIIKKNIATTSSPLESSSAAAVSQTR